MVSLWKKQHFVELTNKKYHPKTGLFQQYILQNSRIAETSQTFLTARRGILIARGNDLIGGGGDKFWGIYQDVEKLEPYV